VHVTAQTRKSIADIVRRRTHSVIIFLAILIPVGGLTAVSVASDSLSSAYAFSISRHAARQDITVAVDHTDTSLLSEINRQPGVMATQTATVLDTQWHVAAAPGRVDFRIVGYPDPRHVPLSPFQVVSGHYPGLAEIVMEYGDLGLQRFQLGDRVTVDSARGSRTLRVVGFARTPGMNPATSGIGIGYMTTAALDRIAAFGFTPGPVQRQPFRSQEVALKLRNASGYQGTVRSLAPLFRSHHTTVLGVFPPEQNAPVAQLEGILSLVRVLLAVALLLAVILVMNAMTALVAGQARVIGTMKALGASRSRVVKGYATTVLIYGLAATPIGVTAGIFVGGWVSTTMEASIPLAPGARIVSSVALALAVAVGLLLPVLAALVPLWLGTRITVHEALADWGVTTVETRRRSRVGRTAALALERFPQTVGLGLRGLLRKPWRATISIITVAVAATCFLVVQSVAASVNGSIGSVWGSFQADVEIYVGGNSSYREISDVLAHVPNVRRVERVGWFGSETTWGKVGVWGIEPNSGLRHTAITSGHRLKPGASGVCLVSDDLAARAGLHVGSTITVPGPGRARARRFTVIGTMHEPVDGLGQVGTIDMSVNDLYRLEGAPASHLGDFTNRVLVQAVNRSPAAVDDLTRAIDAVGRRAVVAGKEGPIARVFSFKDEVVRHKRSFLPVYLLLVAVALVVGAVGSLGLADALTASVVDGRRNIGLLRSLGASGRRVATVFWIEGIALSLAAWFLACIAGVPLAYLFVQLFRRRVMPTDFHFDPFSLALAVAVTLALASAATMVPARRAAAMRTAELLRTE
jgi:putative ABC transport system permease protein